jgi:hypothetical protein
MKTIEERKDEIQKEVDILSSGDFEETIMVPIKMYFRWDSGETGYTSDDLDDDKIVYKLNKNYVEPAVQEFEKKCNKRISKVIKKSNALAKELGIDPNEFFRQFC